MRIKKEVAEGRCLKLAIGLEQAFQDPFDRNEQRGYK